MSGSGRLEPRRHCAVVAEAAARGTGWRRARDRRREPARALHQFLERARGLLAAGHAAGQASLRAVGDRLGIGLAEIAALAAILLRHRRHQPLRAAACPRRAAAARRARSVMSCQGNSSALRLGCGASAPRRLRGIGREPAVEPGALGGAEGRVLGQERARRRLMALTPPRRRRLEQDASASSTEWRCGEIVKGFSPSRRCAR